ncbi:aryl-alcohol dehydrogenase-like predicted oxidoreductase [Pacificibacter maritimus]|uniref:Aryl-alcohol dehydrogenase-like predicted oxidoreductase n=1 Tax=Pacificibacter maritimus TaxID=762213 RepID=A0A3N4UYI3_9RHOB|nr:aldo/keto reductase [Pacificibacter maritimus]RPE66630.1 aryl-alcohol dehydrogenase-like predicted oxidoreductase [Pacificibacter maritimus]
MSKVERANLAPGYEISRILKGSWHLAGGHGAVDRDTAIAEMYAYMDAGITAFDCADIYTGVEELIGAFRADCKAKGRNDLLDLLKVHTKCVPDLDKLATIQKSDLQATIDRSLRRLNADRLDLVQFNWWDMDVPRHLEVASWLSDFQKEGKIDKLGTTNFNTDQMQDFVASGFHVSTIQTQFSLIDRRPTKKMVDFCAANNIKILCYGTVAGGFLSDKWLGVAEPVGEMENRSLTKYKLIIDDIGGWDAFQSLLRLLRRIADKHGVDIASVAMRAMLAEPQVAGIIVGVRHGGHLGKHAALFDLQLDSDDMAQIQAAIDGNSIVDGDCYDVERDRNGRHGRIMKYNLSEH